MGKFLAMPLLAAASVVIAACGGGKSITAAPPSNTLSVGPSNTVTEARADVSRAPSGQILLQMTDGPMAGMSVECVDATLGRCIVTGGPDGTSAEGVLLQRMHGQYAFVGNFNILQVLDGNLQGQSIYVHSTSPDASGGPVNLPQDRTQYTGAFHAGAGLANGPSGMVNGSVQMVADFNQGVLSVRMDGSFEDGTALNASFSNITINASNGQFTTTDDSIILFQGALADGDMLGAFYGPFADEAAGIFQTGNDLGGMSGMFLACKGLSTDCIQP
ncbi:MAG: hypothetical protein JJU07_07475 [Natronohydrobacter sp.]|nr:hypothetical protein [Natronohydrobacter sp.]